MLHQPQCKDSSGRALPLSLFTSLSALEDFCNVALTLSPEQAADLDNLIRDYHNQLSADDGLHFHRLYTDACILKSIHNVSPSNLDPLVVPQAIEYLDKAIIVAGAAGPGRHDLILDLIQRIQSEHTSRLRPSPLVDVLLSTPAPPAPAPVLAARQSVPRFKAPPSLVSFQRSFASRPFIVPGHASDWPALNEHPWNSIRYLQTVSGPGRVVPVEVGSDYRTDDWSQKIMGWDDFLMSLTQPSGEVLYLAQHNIFLQFPSMREDVIVPDYVYSCPNSPDSFPDYRPPTNDEQLVLNVWLGPRGTISPAHVASGFRLCHVGGSRKPKGPISQLLRFVCIDHPHPQPTPDCERQVQVVGRKTVWLAPPWTSSALYIISQCNPSMNKEIPQLSNTSQVDVFATNSSDEFPRFWEEVAPEAMTATLEPGDLLFFPPGWWHAFRSEDVSFSVSMWW